MTTESSKIVKRLELIKGLIILEEVTEIDIHAARLRDAPQNDDLKFITDLLAQKAYSQVIPAIDKFLQSYSAIAPYIDPELEALKLEAKILEKEINDLSSEKADLERLIHEFGVRHSNELGELILKILSHRKKKARGTPQQAETEKDYNDFSQKYQIALNEKDK